MGVMSGVLSARSGKSSKLIQEASVGNRPVRSEQTAAGNMRPGGRSAFGKPAAASEGRFNDSGRASSQGSIHEGDSDEEVDLDDEDSNSLAARLKVAIDSIMRGDMAGVARALVASHEMSGKIDEVYMNDLLVSLFLQASDPQVVPPGETFVTQGVAPDCIFLILSGTAVVRKMNADGTYTELSQLRTAGEVIGDISFLTGGTPLASVVATPLAVGQTEPLEPTRVCSMGFSHAASLLESQPQARAALIQRLSLRRDQL